MAKKDIKEKKNIEIQNRLIKEAEFLGITKDDPILKESLANVTKVAGSSKGRNKILTEELIKLDKYVKNKATIQEKEKNKVEITPEMETIIQDRVKEMVNVKLDEILKNMNLNYETSGVSIEQESIKENQNASEITNEYLGVENDGLGFKELWEATKNVSSNIKEKGAKIYVENKEKAYETGKEVIEKTTATYNKAKGNVIEGVSGAYEHGKNIIENSVNKVKSYGSKFAQVSIEAGSRQINNVLSFFEKVKDYDLKGKVKTKIKDFTSKFEKSKYDVFEKLENNRNVVEEIYENRKIEQAKEMTEKQGINFENKEAKSNIKSFMIGDNSAGYLYEINHLGVYTKSAFVNGQKGPAYTINPIEFERERDKYFENSNELENDNAKEIDEFDMSK